MKLKNKLITIAKISTILIFLGVMGNCDKRNTKDRESQSALLSLITARNAPASVTNACKGAVIALNACIAEGYGFSPATMCNQDVTSNFTASDYDTLANCATTVKATTSCHLNQNKFPNAQSAFSNSQFLTAGVSGTTSFSSCNKTATTANGQTINIMVY